ncbi:uncharacterized protein LOC124811548 isoform X5 [Hydra vulgaris]|uniref:uncharacterized protein LOC124811548 isoform X5 n=2 Tax=Hydra vulgaris TaxID=6087 RepID=UPI001F5F029B|nr:uncharacterized protein LOC124811548 isoform X5 [Hydra vulgaris]
MLQFKTLLLNVLLTNSICCQFYYDTTYKSDNSLVYSLQKTYPAAHYEAFLRCPTSSSAMSALVPSSIALSVPSTSAIIALLTFSYIFSCYKWNYWFKKKWSNVCG